MASDPIGGLRFDGVKVLKQEIKGSGADRTYCVWTDAGYIEYKEQKKDENGYSQAAVHAVKYSDTVDQKGLFISDVTNATMKLDSSKYQGGVAISGDDEKFVLDAKNGQTEKLIKVFNNAQVISDRVDYVVRQKIYMKFLYIFKIFIKTCLFWGKFFYVIFIVNNCNNMQTC